MKNFLLTIFILIIVTSNTACAAISNGNVLPIGAYTTASYVVGTVRGTATAGTIYVNAESDAFMFFGQVRANEWWEWAITNKGGITQPLNLCANRMNCLTFVDLLTDLTDHGWRQTYSTDLPEWLKPIVASTQALLNWATKIELFPVFIVIPGGDLMSPPALDQVQD